MLRILVLALGLYASASSSANAQHVTPYHYTGVIDGVHYGWGWWPAVYYPGFYYPNYGYSYYPYWGYQPYYATFSAISYSLATGRYGASYGQPTLDNAVAVSQSHCLAGDCQPMVWAQGGCAALALGDNPTHVTYGYHTHRYQAQNYALRACHQTGGISCRILVWSCSY